MVLAHYWRQPALEFTEQIAEATVAIAIRVGVPVFLPQHHQIDAGPLQFARQHSPVRLDAPPLTRLNAGPHEQPPFEFIVGQFGRQRPAKTHRAARFRLSCIVLRAKPSRRPISRALTPS